MSNAYLEAFFQDAYNRILPRATIFSEEKKYAVPAWQNYYLAKFEKDARKAIRQAIDEGRAAAPELDSLTWRIQLYPEAGSAEADLRGKAAAFEAQNIQQVRWVAKMDTHTCDVCRKRHGRIYPVRRVPTIAHHHCRCTIEPLE